MNYAVVGAFVLGLGAALIAGVLWLASGGALRTQVDLYLAIMDESVAGLNLNAPVKYNGVDVGKVREIQLDPANPQRVRLLFAIERGTPVKVDTVAVLKTQGLTGIAYVELTGGAQHSAPLLATADERYPVISTKPSLGARLENVLTSVLAKLDHTSSNIDALLSDANRAALSSMLGDLAAVSKTLAGRKESLDAGIASAARSFDKAERLMAQLGPVVERLGPVVARIGRSAEAVETMGREAALASTRAGKMVDSVGADVKAVGNDVQRFSAETLPELQRLLSELNVLSGSLRRLGDQTERNPASLLVGRAPVPDGPGESPAGQHRP